MSESVDLGWYVAMLVFEPSLAGGWSHPSADIQLRLIRAVEADSAFQRALELGREGEHAYENPDGQTCVWSSYAVRSTSP